MLVTPCLCFRYKVGADSATGTFSAIEEGGYIVDVGADGTCKTEVRDPLWDGTANSGSLFY
jgi:hypothetical protein